MPSLTIDELLRAGADISPADADLGAQLTEIGEYEEERAGR